MKLLVAGKKRRGVDCLRALASAGHEIVGVIAPQPTKDSAKPDGVALAARELGYQVFEPADVNDGELIRRLRSLDAELTVLAGYGQIVKRDFIELAPFGCINLHAGRLPQYRGSSPLNWALINGETEFTLSIIQVNEGVDAGDVLWEQRFEIAANDTIADLHGTANRVFPEGLLDVISQVESGDVQRRVQDDRAASYYPLRFPDDGLVLWDSFTAEQIHNRIRALTDPYPGAFTYYGTQRVKLLESRMARGAHYGEPGRVYMKNDNGLLVCAADRCLWIRRAVFEADGADARDSIKRYKKFATLRDLAVQAVVKDRS